MECHIDAGRKDDALHVGQAAMQFTKSFVSHMCKEVFTLQVSDKKYFFELVSYFGSGIS